MPFSPSAQASTIRRIKGMATAEKASSAMPALNTVSNSDGSKAAGCNSASMSPKIRASGSARAAARSVGTMPCGVRTRISSPKYCRSRASIPLTAGCDRASRPAVRVTLCSCKSTCRVLSRFKSRLAGSFTKRSGWVRTQERTGRLKNANRTGGKRIFRRPLPYASTITASASTCTPLGRAATPTAARAG